MERFPVKLKECRKRAGLSQEELASRIGVTQRSLTDYECGRAVPRRRRIERMADILGVTTLYLINDSIEDPSFGENAEKQIRSAELTYGEETSMEMSELIERNTAFFAGGDIPQEDKDRFFEALMMAYVACKKEAGRRAQ